MSLPHTHYPWGPPCSLGLAQRNISDDGSHPVGTASGTDDISILAGELGPTPRRKEMCVCSQLRRKGSIFGVIRIMIFIHIYDGSSELINHYVIEIHVKEIPWLHPPD